MYPPFLCPKCATLHNIVRKALIGRKLHETKLQCCLEFAARRRDLLYRLCQLRYLPFRKTTVFAQKLGGSFTTEMTMTMEDWTAAGTLSRLGDGAWSVSFAEPATLAGVVLDFSGGEVTASYKGLGFSVPQSAMPAKSVLNQMIQVVDELAQQEEITGKEQDGCVSVEGDLEGNPYTLTLTENGDLSGFTMENFDTTLTFTQFQSGAAVATETTTLESR